MGYSITVRVRGKKLHVKALDFMQKQFRDWSKVHPDFEMSHSLRGPLSGPSLSYDRNKASIGFDYSCLPDLERHYVWCILHWMALMFGDKRKFNGAGPYPFYVYDGHESCVVLVGNDWKNRPESLKHYKECQPDGWLSWPFSDDPARYRNWLAIIMDYCFSININSCEKIIRAELSRLTTEWNKEVENGQS